MNPELRKFLKKLLILASIVGIIIIAVLYALPPEKITPALPYLLIFHVAATLISFMYIQKKTTAAPGKFINVYMASTTVKLLLYIAILMVYALNNLHDAVNFIVSFFILYLIFTVYEVIELVNHNKRLTRK